MIPPPDQYDKHSCLSISAPSITPAPTFPSTATPLHHLKHKSLRPSILCGLNQPFLALFAVFPIKKATRLPNRFC